MKMKKEIKNLQMFESKNLNKIIGGATNDGGTGAIEAAKGTKGTSATTGWHYTDNKDGSNVVWSA